MIRTQISFTEAQMRALRAEAERRGVSMAAVVRDAVDSALGARSRQRELLWQRALGAVGRFRAGDQEPVAEEHDPYLADIYADHAGLNRTHQR